VAHQYFINSSKFPFKLKSAFASILKIRATASKSTSSSPNDYVQRLMCGIQIRSWTKIVWIPYIKHS